MPSHRKPAPAKKKSPPANGDKQHLNDLLDEALEETFPASDTPALVEPVHRPKKKKGGK